ncbi:cytochrome c [Aestuariicoccus sp. MJ-SS9]|uniref:c-type cytochrome n=1 Tax=Aestuariicoccus sp. MJ-SS9 TaxID=3079855 RepID=UPI0029144813|nr:cytochrome c [Aestuariicoccus sp. MJ-SS9]MDU8912820.1 cytochrome c [Aestuariicoccus sp. MJ-SS9]
MKTPWIAAALTGAIMTGCTAMDEMPQPGEGRALFQENCAVCHGAEARGDGPMADGLDKKPADLTRIAARNGGSFPRAEVLSLIDGYARSDLEGPGMPEFGELLKGDLVPLDTGDGILTPTPRKLVALMEYLESIQTGQ